LIEAPVETVWELLGNPRRHPEWWPRIVEIDGQPYEQGDEYVQITSGPMGNAETRWLLEHKDDLREIKLRCQLTGTYADWHLTGAQGGTFVDLEMGMDPTAFKYRVFDLTVGSRFFRKWAEESIDALCEVAKSDAAASGTQPVLADRDASEPH
jgi:Polyketide cyclase / dehydrase and lipid transport